MTPITIALQKNPSAELSESTIGDGACLTSSLAETGIRPDLFSLPTLQNFFKQTLPDTAGLARRASFFATKEVGLLETPDAVPLQSCTNLNVSTSSIYFGDVRINTSTTQYFRISNPNCCSVNYSVTSPGYGFSITSTGGTIPANSSVSIGVTFNPYYVQSYSGSISISPSGSSVSVSGRGIN